MTNARPHGGRYETGGVITKVGATEEHLLLSIDEFFGSARLANGAGNHDIAFEFATTALPVWAHQRPSEAGTVYDCPLFRCWDSGHRRWLEVPDAAFVVCDLKANTAFASVRVGADPWIVAHYAFYPLWAQMLKKTGLHHIHAACMTLDGKGLLLPGASGSGKSTLSINLLRHGFDFVSDDTVFLRSSGNRVIAGGLAENVKVSRETAALFAELEPIRNQAPEPTRQKLHFDVGSIFGASIKDSAAPKTIIFPRFTGGRRTLISPISPAEALTRLFEYSIFMADPFSNADHFELLSNLIGQASCFAAEIGSDNNESASAIQKILEEMPI